jgi:DNA-binding CsgD family transcriptional regulator
LTTETLSHSDVLVLNRAIGEIYSARDMDAFYRSLFSSIHDLIPVELCSCSEVSLNPTRFVKVFASSEDHSHVTHKHLPALNAYLHEHPLVPHFATDNVFKTTDFASQNQFKNKALYNEYYRHLDIDTQIGFSMPISQQNIALLALSRNTIDYSERDRLILALLKLHCINALRNVTEFGRMRLERDLLQNGAVAEKKGAVLCQSNGMIVCISAFAQEMCGRYFGARLTEGDTLPGRLFQWLEAETDLSQSAVIGGSAKKTVKRKPLVVEKEGKRLTIKLLHDCTTGDYVLCFTETDPTAVFRSLQGYGLSNRETEVLFWLSQGKTNFEVATILGMSKRTADKHLEHIFVKLGVETRAAAIVVMRGCYSG